MSFRKNLLGIPGIILTFAIIGFAQQPQTPTTTQDGTLKRERLERRERLRGMREPGFDNSMRRHGFGNSIHGIELSEEQKQQSRAIMQRRLESTKAQREELFKLREKRIAGTFSADDEARARALHQEIRTAMQGARTEMQGVLTAEQKARLEEAQKERKAKREQRLRERNELRNRTQ